MIREGNHSLIQNYPAPPPELTDEGAKEWRATLSFVPVVSESAQPAAAEPTVSLEAPGVTVELQGARVEVRGTPGLAVLSDVFLALRRTRSC